MSANRTFSLCAAAGSLLISVLSAVKGHLAVAIVFAILFVGFAARAAEGREPRASDPPAPPPLPPHAPKHEPERRLGAARFRRR